MCEVIWLVTKIASWLPIVNTEATHKTLLPPSAKNRRIAATLGYDWPAAMIAGWWKPTAPPNDVVEKASFRSRTQGSGVP
jgi:hypothetical protein